MLLFIYVWKQWRLRLSFISSTVVHRFLLQQTPGKGELWTVDREMGCGGVQVLIHNYDATLTAETGSLMALSLSL